MEPVGITFTETMRGYCSVSTLDSYELAYQRGKQDSSPFEFTLTVTSNNLEQMLADPDHTAALAGTVTAPALSSGVMRVVSGQFHLFVRDPQRVATRLMRYEMTIEGESGDRFYFVGFKIIHDDPGFDVWSDTTTLYITVFRGEESRGSVIGKGILRILPRDFLRQLTTTRAVHAQNAIEASEAVARFGQFFAGVLYEVYGGIFARRTRFNPDAPPRTKRALRACAPEVHFCAASDGVQLRLTRYRGGAKGPVMLAHGLGVSGRIFTIDTIETNLVEYLYSSGYDVWVLDYRASIELASSASQFTADDIATKDYPAAVAQVRKETGAAGIQVVAHCYGATTFCMALCAGLQGVRAAVCSQIATHVVAATANRIRTGLHLPEFLSRLGVQSLSAYVDTHAEWLQRLYDRTLELYPVGEHCTSPVCQRITFMYAPLYKHEQLNSATHDALHEMFGVANIQAFEGLALMTRKGHVVAADGSEAYLPHLNRMAIPIAFVHGQENECFLSQSTEITFNQLRQVNIGTPYSRAVIPGYGHIDCIFGRDAARDVYPVILQHLESTA